MDDVIGRGSDHACKTLSWVQSRWYEQMCLGSNNTEMFYKAGIYFWLAAFTTLFAALWAVRHVVRYIFD